MAVEGDYPLLALPPGELVPPVPRRPPRGGALNPSKKRQLERLEPQFKELQRVLDAGNAAISSSALGAAPEHVLVFETNGPPQGFFDEVRKHPELDWLLEREERVDADEDFRPAKGEGQITSCIYMVMFNQVALEQLLSCWHSYSTRPRVPRGLGAWSSVFRCLRRIRRWGPEDRLRESDLLRDLIEPIEPDRTIPVEIELWPRHAPERARAEAIVRGLIADAGGQVLDSVVIEDIAYHALLAALPVRYLRQILDNRDVELVQADDIYLIRPTPQCTISPVANEATVGSDRDGSPPQREPICALLDGLPMENHPQLRHHLVVDDPDGWGATYPVNARFHATGMASLIVHGDQHENQPSLSRPLYVRPVLQFDPASGERAPRERLWVDLIHQAVRRMVATDGPDEPVAPSICVINLSVGDSGRPFLHEPSPLARLLDWLAWKYSVLFVISAGNHSNALPNECGEDAGALRHIFEQRRHRRLLSPAESINGITVGALNIDGAPTPIPQGQRIIPARQDVPAAYSALGRGLRRSVKPELLAPGGRQAYREELPTRDARWVVVPASRIGHLVAAPGPPSSRQVRHSSGTSNAAALTSRALCFIYESLEEVLERDLSAGLRDVPRALLLKALMVHSAEWTSQSLAFLQRCLDGLLHRTRGKDELGGVLGYGVIRPDRSLGCAQQRATAIGGGVIAAGQRHIHRIPAPACLHLHDGWRRLTGTLAWFSPINPRSRKYRVARLALELPKGSNSPLAVEGGQVHSDATGRGTVQHQVVENHGAVINLGPGEDLEVAVTCEEDAGQLSTPIAYALALSLEVAPETTLPIYEQVAARLRVATRVPVRR
jgi:subtilase family protein